MNMKQSLDKLERVPLREAWKHEADDFTSWVAHATTGNDGLGTKTYCQSLTVTKPSHPNDRLLPR